MSKFSGFIISKSIYVKNLKLWVRLDLLTSVLLSAREYTVKKYGELTGWTNGSASQVTHIIAFMNSKPINVLYYVCKYGSLIDTPPVLVRRQFTFLHWTYRASNSLDYI